MYVRCIFAYSQFKITCNILTYTNPERIKTSVLSDITLIFQLRNRDYLICLLASPRQLGVDLVNSFVSGLREVEYSVEASYEAYDGEEEESPVDADEIAEVSKPLHLDEVAELRADVGE